MSKIQHKDNEIVPEGTKLTIHQINPSNTVRVAFYLFFAFLIEIFLAYYVYRLFSLEMRENYLSKNDFQTQMRTEAFREEVLKIFTDMELKRGHKLEVKSPPITAARKKRSVGSKDEIELLSSCQKIKDFCLQIPGHNGPPSPTDMTGQITRYNQFSGSNVGQLCSPPMILESQNGSSELVSANEGQPVRLNCSATGHPAPRITWQRLRDGRPINPRTWGFVSRVSSIAINAIMVNRDDMGRYRCIAENGISPAANHTFDLEVNFSPKINIENPIVEVAKGSTVVLECDVEAFPEPLHFWELSGGTLLGNDNKFRIFNSDVTDLYKYKTQLKITNVTFDDMKYQYRCNSKNEINITTGEITLRVLDQSSSNVSKRRISRSPVLTKSDVLVDLVTRWEIRPYGNISYQDNITRTSECVLHYIGKPVFHRFSKLDYGCWMTDAHPDARPGYIWVTQETRSNELFEFRDKFDYKNSLPSTIYTLKKHFSGNSQAVYNGFFFYHIKGTNRIIKYGLKDNSTKYLDLPGDMTRRSKLYSGQHNYVDICVDENGLWLIFAVEDSNNTAVMKVDYENMTPQYAWNITLEHQKVGEMFIVCGVLYAVDSVTDQNTKIRIAFDLYKNVLLDVNLKFTNSFRKTTMLSYNHKTQELYSWDKGYQLTYPIRSHDIGYNYHSEEDLTELLPNYVDNK